MKNADSQTQTETGGERRRHTEMSMEIWTHLGIDIHIETKTETHKDRQTLTWTDSGRKRHNEKVGTDRCSHRPTKAGPPKTRPDKDSQKQNKTLETHRYWKGFSISAVENIRERGAAGVASCGHGTDNRKYIVPQHGAHGWKVKAFIKHGGIAIRKVTNECIF